MWQVADTLAGLMEGEALGILFLLPTRMPFSQVPRPLPLSVGDTPPGPGPAAKHILFIVGTTAAPWRAKQTTASQLVLGFVYPPSLQQQLWTFTCSDT